MKAPGLIRYVTILSERIHGEGGGMVIIGIKGNVLEQTDTT